jgi:hypothetical protein
MALDNKKVKKYCRSKINWILKMDCVRISISSTLVIESISEKANLNFLKDNQAK